MRIANLDGRAVIIAGDRAVDIARSSDGEFGPDPLAVFDRWSDFRAWADVADLAAGDPFDVTHLGAPVPMPRQVFAIGLNYRDHADEAGLAYPEALVVFTKFQSSIGAPDATVTLPPGFVDYETELVAVIGRRVHDVDEADAWSAVAGLSVGQDYSERVAQRAGPVPQFSLAKSHHNFTPFGPTVVTPDEFADPGALSVRAVLERAGAAEDLVVQDGNTRDMVFPVARIVADLSRTVTLFPGDLIFSGTPAGVGAARGISLAPGDVLTSTIDGIGSIRNHFVAA